MPTNDSKSSPEPELQLTHRLQATLAEEHPDVRVWAAGGLVLRKQEKELELLIVHRPIRDDWSFPKGKLDEGETLAEAAQREVQEETGYTCRLLEMLPAVRYLDAKRREKLVVYWTMEVEDGDFVPNDEVDSLGWFTLGAAEGVLTYTRDIEVLDAIRPTKQRRRMPA